MTSAVDLFDAREARDRAVEQVSHNAGRWVDRALEMVSRVIPPRAEVTSEEIRFALTDNGLEAPHHYNAWGALTVAAVKRGLLVDTGRLGQMRGPKSHARRTPIWRRA